MSLGVIIIDAETDGPRSVIADCSIALGIMLAMQSADVLDAGQRHTVEEAMERLDAVTDELTEAE